MSTGFINLPLRSKEEAETLAGHLDQYVKFLEDEDRFYDADKPDDIQWVQDIQQRLRDHIDAAR